MKKLFSVLMIAIVLTSALLFNVSQASAASRPTLTDTRFVSGKGIVFVFDYNAARLRGPNIKGAALYLHGNTYPLSCKVNAGKDTIVCIAGGGLTEFAGDAGSVSLLGHMYPVVIPAMPEVPECIDCCIGPNC